MGLFNKVETGKIGENSGPTRRILETDVYLVTVAGIIDLGTQKNRFHNPDDPKSKPYNEMMRFILEVVDEVDDDGNTVLVRLDVTNSTHEKSTMTKVLLACSRGDETQTYGELLDGAVGKSLRVQIEKKVSKADREYNRPKASTICALSKREEDVPMQGEPVLFSLKAPDIQMFKNLTKYTIKTIMESPEGAKLPHEFHDHYLELFKDEDKKEQDTSALE